jgi:transposase-like protein
MELTMPRRKKYDKEFKLKAIKLYEESEKNQREYEAELGIGAGCISHWMRELKDEKENVFPGNGNPRDEEMTKLRRENEILRQERDILKKALGIFSKTPL